MDWYWIVVTSPDGKTFIHDVPFRRSKEAERVSEERYASQQSKVVPMETSNRVEAARIIRESMASLNSGNWGRNFSHVK